MFRFQCQLDFVTPNSAQRDRLRVVGAGWSNRHRAATTKAALARAIEDTHRDHISPGTYQCTGYGVLTRDHVTVRRLSSGRTDLRAIEVSGVVIIDWREIQSQILTG